MLIGITPFVCGHAPFHIGQTAAGLSAAAQSAGLRQNVKERRRAYPHGILPPTGLEGYCAAAWLGDSPPSRPARARNGAIIDLSEWTSHSSMLLLRQEGVEPICVVKLPQLHFRVLVR